VKCPKCAYLGFETGERCKNCGYDFSLLASHAFDTPPPDSDVTIRAEDFTDESMDMWLRDLDQALPTSNLAHFADQITPPTEDERAAESAPASQALEAERPEEPVDLSFDPRNDLPEAAIAPTAPTPHLRSVESALPLFIPDDEDDDRPLVTLPAAPRPPLAVRRTPDVPRLRDVSRFRSVEPALDFRGETESEAGPITDDRDGGLDLNVDIARSVSGSEDLPSGSVGGRRLAAAVIDHVILLSIDLVVVYFTLRMAGLQASEWRMIPALPIGIFLGMMAFAYFAAFTAVGGQTIGKMATGIRVVGEDRRAVDGVAASRRTFTALLSYVTVGLAYLPGFFGDRRTVHDRVSRTRVVAPPSA
jgi:uncharacterized RDD family membrane protein YckC